MLEVGIKGYQEFVVAEKDTARVHKSGTLDVLATPAMIALMEETAWKSVAEQLEPQMGTVGTSLNIKHLAPTPVGMKVWCETLLEEIEGRRLVFSVNVFDETGSVGEGIHERFIVEEDKFQNKANKKNEK